MPYGRASYVFIQSTGSAAALAASVEVGVMINRLGFMLLEMPFGGVRDSGSGSEGRAERIEVYLTPSS